MKIRCKIGHVAPGAGNASVPFWWIFADSLAVTAVFRGENQRPLIPVVVAVRPAKVGALLDLEHLFGRKVRSLILVVELAPVLMELIAAVLRRVELTTWIEGNAYRVANAGRVSLRG